MKKILMILFSVLLVWNIFLTTQLSLSNERIEQLENTSNINQTVPQNDPDRVTIIESDTTSIQEVVNNVSPAVVTINSIQNNQITSTGSGVVYSKSDETVWIVTNNHVIENGTNFSVLFSNQEVIEAQLIGTDVYSDLAVLKATIDFEINPITFGDSTLLETGQSVLAIGSPGGENFAGTVTKGIVSGTNRVISVDLDGDFRDDWDMVLVQTDAAINPGNSGGALVNLNGELIGINTIKIADEAFEGMGFAIPSNEVISIISQLETNGEVQRPSLGVSVFSINEANNYTRYLYRIDENSGLYVSEVISDSPADNAGVIEGDVISKVNGETIESFSQFRRILYSHQPGEPMMLEIIRDGDSIQLTVNL